MSTEPSKRFRENLAGQITASVSAPIPPATPRRVHGTIAFPGKVTAVIGMRRAGKTTFLHQLRGERLASGVPQERLPYINFEDERLAGFQMQDLDLLNIEYYRQVPAARGRDVVTWCFDEIQVVPGWERFTRRLLDSEKVEMFVSGSSAALLSREVATSMRGRGWEVVIHPFSFEEFLRHSGVEVPEQPWRMASELRSRIESSLRAYLEVGGFPEVQRLDVAERQRLLTAYVDVAILRDVIERHGVGNVAGVRWLVRHLLSNPAGKFSAEKFHRALRSQGIAISRDTVHEILGYLEDCFLVRTVWVEADSERRRMVNPRKAYPVDTGLIPLFEWTGKANLGHALETAVMIELERRRCRMTYVRTVDGLEVDFLARSTPGHDQLIQVAADLDSSQTREREVRALLAAAAEHPRASLHLITLTPETAREIPGRITVHSAAEWLLSPEVPGERA
jgi:predicted AAA+ superfamily ATPase